MNKKFLPLAVIGAVVILAIGAFAVLNNRGSLPGVGERVEVGGSTLRDLLARGVSQQCTYKDEESEGTVYVSGERMRIDYKSMVDGREVSGHMILDRNTTYMWEDGSDTGFKYTYEVPEGEDPDTSVSSEALRDFEALDADRDVEYNCRPWVVNASFFNPPSDINFQDFSDFTIPQGMEVPEGFDPSDY